MPRLRLDILDVFAEQKLAGNQLAVVRDAADLSGDEMQAMALEMNFSETTFVQSECADRARVRIFTPTEELPFAGHPTLGTAWLLGHDRTHFVLELAAGDVRVDIANDLATMQPPPVKLHETFPRDEIAACLDVSPNRIDPRFRPQRGEVGIEFLFVGFEKVEVLESLEMNLERLRALPSFGLFAFAENETTARHSTGADYRARMFFESAGLREDPATGSANSIFAAYLAQSRGRDFSAIVDQGVEMGRPSRIYLDVKDDVIRVGGRVQRIVEGTWALDASASIDEVESPRNVGVVAQT